MSTRAIIFDCFGVLWSCRLSDIFAKSTQNDPQKLEQFLGFCRQADYGEITPQELWLRISQLMEVSMEECKRLVDAERHVNYELFQYIREDLRNTYKIGMLSNACADIWEYVTPDQQELFDTTIISADIHRCKPDAEAYLEISRRLQVAPEECIMIDDRLENCKGAQRVGMKAIRYQDFARLRAELSDALVVL